MNKFTQSHRGSAVVFNRADGSSSSGRIEKVSPDAVTFRAADGVTVETVWKQNWHRLTLFPRDSFFMVT